MVAASLSDYQCECANPNAVKTPQTYKQGPVVRLDRDVREAQKWAGVDDPKGASMTRETRTALRDKIADYQKQNGIEAKTPGELNKDTLDRMRQDKSLPQGLTDSLQKVNPYYKPDALPRIICVTKPGEDVKPAVISPAAPKANEGSYIGGGMASSAPVKAVPEKANLDKMGIVNQDVPPEREAKFYADMSVKFAEMVQKKCNLPPTGKMDDTTIAAMKTDPQFKDLSPQVDKWKSAGLIDKDGNWDQKRHVEMRVESWGVKEPAAQSAGPKDSAPAQDNPFAGKKWEGSEGLIIKGPARSTDPAPEVIRGPARLSDPGPTTILMTASDNYLPGGKLGFEGSAQPSFVAAKEHKGPQSLEVMAREPQSAPQPDSGTTNQRTVNLSSIVAP